MMTLATTALLWMTGSLLTQWTVELPRPRTSLEWAQEYRVGGFAADDEAIYFPSVGASLQKRDRSKGGLIWESPLEANSQGLWVVEGHFVYGGDTKGNVYSIDIERGQRQWIAKAKGIFFAAPFIDGDRLIIMNSLGTLQAYDKTTGEWLWQQADPAIGSLSLWSSVSALKIGSSLYAGFPSALLQAINPISGQVLWKESFTSSVTSAESLNDLKSLARAAGSILLASSYEGNLVAWSFVGDSRKKLWEKSLSLYAPVTVDSESNTLYASGRDGSIQAIDTQTGYVRWRKELPRGLGTSATIDGDRLWIGSSEGQVFVFDRAGDLLAQTHVYETAIWNAPLLNPEDRSVLILTAQGILRKLKFVSNH